MSLVRRIIGVSAGLVIGVAMIFGLGTGRASADETGLNFGCRDLSAESEEDGILGEQGLNDALNDLENLGDLVKVTYEVLAPPGPGQDPVEVTSGEYNFSALEVWAWPFGIQTVPFGFQYGIHLDNDANQDVTFGFRLRDRSYGQIDQLWVENFGLGHGGNEANVGGAGLGNQVGSHTMAGLDVQVTKRYVNGVSTVDTAFPHGIVVKVGLKMGLSTNENDEPVFTHIKYTVDNIDSPGELIPSQNNLTFGAKADQYWDFWAFEMTHHFHDPDNSLAQTVDFADHPPIRDGLEIYQALGDGTDRRDIVDVTAAFDRAPGAFQTNAPHPPQGNFPDPDKAFPIDTAFAAGIHEVCPQNAIDESLGHLAINSDDVDGTVPGDDNAVDLDVRVNPGQGIAGEDKIVFDGELDGIPERFDMWMTPKTLQIHRSDDVRPDFTIDKLQIASGDPNLPLDDYRQEPLVVTGHILGLPELGHLVMVRDTPNELDEVGVYFCADAATPLPDLSFINNYPQLYRPPPLNELECDQNSKQSADEVLIDVRDYFPGTPHTDGIDESTPAGPNSWFVYGNNKNEWCGFLCHQLEARGLFRLGLKVADAKTGRYQNIHPEPGDLEGGVDVTIETETAQTVDAIVHFDSRDKPIILPNTSVGSIIDVTGTLDQLPAGPIVAQYRSADPDQNGTSIPFALRTTAPTFVGHGYGDFRVEMPYDGKHTIARGNFDITDYPSGLDIHWFRNETKVDQTTDTTDHVAYWASRPTTVDVEAEYTTQEDRDMGTRIGLDGVFELPGSPIIVPVLWATWRQTDSEDGEARKLESVEVNSCKFGIDCNNSVDATVARDFDYDANTIAPVALPEIEPGILGDDGRHPDFDEWPSDEGLKAIIRPADVGWGVYASVRNIDRGFYGDDPHVYEFSSVPTGEPFTVNVFTDALPDFTIKHYITDNFALEKLVPLDDLFVDANLSALPEYIGVRHWDEDEGIKVWVTTEPDDEGQIGGDIDDDDLKDDYIDSIITNPNGPETLKGLVRVGQRDALEEQWQGEWLDKSRNTGEDPGIDAQVSIPETGDTIRFAADGWINELVPSGMFLHIPGRESCTRTTPWFELIQCQARERYEIDETNTAGGEFYSTLPTFGTLTARLGVGELVDETVPPFNSEGKGQPTGRVLPKFTLDADVPEMPGDLEVFFKQAKNRRLPWSTYNVEVDGFGDIGDVNVRGRFPNEPRFYRTANDPADPGSYQVTDLFNFQIEDLPSKVNFDVRLLDPEFRVDPPDLTEEINPCDFRDEGLFHYAHARLDFKNAAESVQLDARRHATDVTTGRLTSDEPIDVDVRFRQDHIATGVCEHKDNLSTGAAVGIGLGIAAVFGPTFGVIFGILEAVGFFDTDFDVTLDLDLPVRLRLDNVTDTRFGLNGTTWSIDLNKGTNASGDLRIQQRNMPGEDSLNKAGAYFHERDVDLTGDIITDRHETNHNEFADIGVYDWQRCMVKKPWKWNDSEPDKFCYWNHSGTTLNGGDISKWENTRDDARDDTNHTVHDAMVDFLWDEGNRSWFKNKDDNVLSFHTGSKLYRAVATASRPAEEDDWIWPDLSGGEQLQVHTASFWEPLLNVWPNCDVENEGGQAADGTTYVIHALHSPCNAFESFDLEARHPNGATRWAVALPEPHSFNDCPFGVCRYLYSVTPLQTGDIIVQESTRAYPNPQIWPNLWFDIGGYNAVYDASGYPGSDDPDAGLARRWDGAFPGPIGYDEVAVWSINDITPAQLVPTCPDDTPWYCGEPEPGHRYVWLYGDGDTSGRELPDKPDESAPAGAKTAEHRYAIPGLYTATLLDYDETGTLVGRRFFLVGVFP